MDIKNGAFLYIIGAAIALFVLTQSVYFLLRAVRRGKQIGLSASKMKDAALSSAIFSIVPSLPIVLAMITLAATLGAAFSWIRLSVIGSLAYETYAAGAVAGTLDKGQLISNPVLISIMWIMTIGIISGPLFNILFFKKYQSKIAKLGEKDPKWTKVLTDSLFIGIIAVMGGQYISKGIGAFTGFAPIKYITNGQAQLMTLLSAAVIMALFGLVIKKTKASWLENFALPISMIGAIVLSVIFHTMFTGVTVNG